MGRYPVMVLALSLASVLSVSDDDLYCTQRYARLCQGKGLHVGCRYPFPGPGDGCENYAQVSMDEQMKTYITNYINKRRQKVATGRERVRGGARIPKPELMMFVEWDRELGLLAQRLADQCMFVHDECRATVRYPHAGQSVGEVRVRKSVDRRGLDSMTLKAIRRVLDAWWSEKRRVEPKQLFQPFRVTSKGAVWGHFSQLAVWSLRAVGCGAVRHGTAQPRLLLVCDFSHTNMLGERTLNPGPLAACPQNTARRPHAVFSQLCAARPTESEHTHRYQNEDYDDGETGTDKTLKPAARTRTKVGTKERKTTTKTYLESSGTEDLEQNIENERNKFMNAAKEDRRGSHARATSSKTKLTVYEKEDNRQSIENQDQEEVLGPVEEDDRVTLNFRLRAGEKTRSGQNDMEAFRKGRKMMEEFGQMPRLKSISRKDRCDRNGSKQDIDRKGLVRRLFSRGQAADSIPEQQDAVSNPQVSLMLDKDDHDQFFKDTGFSITPPEKIDANRII